MTDSIVLGVDGGASKTVCVVMDRNRQLLGEGRSESSNPHSVGEGIARSNLYRAIDAALQSAGCRAEEVSAVCAGLAGIDRPAERTLERKFTTMRWWRLPAARAGTFLVSW
ncbi:MAG: hypothetical protein DCC55_32165 [Chloroflexi bacterium]|nr:MAG: hypothetical protein DCC55_32165 [Chloroflexota bacterium]